MKRVNARMLASLLTLFAVLLAPVRGAFAEELTVTATAGSPSSNPVPIDKEITATLTAEATNAPTGTYQCIVGPPEWEWTYDVEYAATAGTWGAPPQGANYSVMIDPPPPDNPSVTQLRASFTVGGYWRITNLKAKVTYTDTCFNEWTADDTAIDIEITVIEVVLSPDPVYVNVGGTALMTATVTPDAEASQVTFETVSSSIATVEGSAPDLTIIGVAEGDTQVEAKLGQDVLASVDVHVVTVSYSPGSGPIFTRIVFSSASPQASFFSENTTVDFEGIFQPIPFTEEHFPPGEKITATHSGTKTSYDSSQPGKIAVAIADVFPSELFTSMEPGVAMGLIGQVRGLVTITDGPTTCTVEFNFDITESSALGCMKNGQFEALDSFDVWTVTSANDFVDVDPEIYLYGEIIRPVNEFTDPPPSTITAEIRTFNLDGTVFNSGVSMDFVLVSTTSSSFTYQTTQPFILMDNPSYVGDQGGLIGILGDDGYVQIVNMPP